MKRDELEKYLGQKVNIVLFDNYTLNGILHKTKDDLFIHDPNIYFLRNYYLLTDDYYKCISCLFRCSHVKKVKILK